MSMHEERMRFALRLAQATQGQTSPNPAVGCVVYQAGRVVGFGSHLRVGEAHAETNALAMAGPEAKGAQLYVTLEPCNHHGRTSPCVDMIISSQISEVYIGMQDADQKVAGKGINSLQRAGITLQQGLLADEIELFYEAYTHHRRTGLPFVTLKMATTLDGKIATVMGDSKWVTNEESRQYVHRLRHENDAILVGVGTVIADDPQLTARLTGGSINPLRVVVDSKLSIPLDAALLDLTLAKTIIFTTDERDIAKEKSLIAAGVRVINTGKGPKVNLSEVLLTLGSEGIISLLVEGGSEVNASLLAGAHIQKVVNFIAPKLLGGFGSKTSIGGTDKQLMCEALNLSRVTVERFEEDICVIGYV